MNALEHFRSGLDYVEIGLALGSHESEVEKQIHELRNAEIEAKAKREARRIAQRDHMRRVRSDLREIRERSRA